METKVEKLAKSHVKLKIKIEHKELSKHFEASYEKVGKTLKIDGFRPGKAPKKIIEEVAGQARLVQETVDAALEETYPKALAENKLYPVNQPKITIDTFPTLESGDFEYTVEFDNLPVAKLKDYSKLTVKPKAKSTVKKEDVDKVLEYLKKQKASFLEVDRPAQKGDRVEINLYGTIKGVPRDGMSSKNHPLVIGENVMIPGFEDQIIGLKKGDKKTFKIKFPKDYHAKDLAGVEAQFVIELIDLKEIKQPEVDKEFAASFGHKDEKAMLEAIEKSLQAEMDEKDKQELEMQVLDKVLPLLETEVPESLVEQEIDRMLGDFRNQVESSGLSFDKYLESLKKDLSSLRKEMTTQAEKNVRIGFLLGEIIKEQKFDHHDKESGRKAIDYLVHKVTKL